MLPPKKGEALDAIGADSVRPEVAAIEGAQHRAGPKAGHDVAGVFQ